MRESTVAAAVLVLLLTACGKRVGSSCKPGESLCMDEKNALVCHGGKLEKVACAGPLGCVKIQDRASCDDSVASEGDPCMGETDEEYACSPDNKRALVCKDGKFALYLECRGKGGCSLLGHAVSCDTSIAAKGDPCRSQGAIACSEDGKQMLECRQGRFETHRYCRGQYGCSLKGEAPTCDETLSLEGDPCGLPGLVVCSVDGSRELICQGGAFMKSRSCKKGCTVTNRPGRPIDCQ